VPVVSREQSILFRCRFRRWISNRGIGGGPLLTMLEEPRFAGPVTSHNFFKHECLIRFASLSARFSLRHPPLRPRLRSSIFRPRRIPTNNAPPLVVAKGIVADKKPSDIYRLFQALVAQVRKGYHRRGGPHWRSSRSLFHGPGWEDAWRAGLLSGTSSKVRPV